MRSTLMATALCLATIPAVAQSKLEPNPGDAHVMFVEYDADKTIPITMQVGQETDVILNPMETIKQIVIPSKGDVKTVDSVNPQSGNQTPLINNVPLVGIRVGRATVTVLTSTLDGHEQSYIFPINVMKEPGDGGLDDKAMLLVKFRYHAQEKQVAVKQAQMTWKEKQAEKQRQIAEARLNVDPLYGPQNYKYIVQTRSNEIAPVRVTDNGRKTWFQYPGSMSQPTVLLVKDGMLRPSVCDGKQPTSTELKGAEQTLNTEVYNDMIGVWKLAPHFRLRSGETDVGEVYNCAYSPVGANPGTGTDNPDVYRRVVTSAQ